MKISKSGVRGSTILEQAIALPVLLVFVLGAFDIHATLQSYAVLQEGVKSALRCTYTSDGMCVNAQVDTRPRLYEVAVLNNSNPSYYSHLHDYSGTASWLEVPHFRYSPQAQILSGVHFDLMEQLATAREKLYNAQASVEYRSRVSSFPRIAGHPLNPTFHYRHSNAVYTPAHTSSPNFTLTVEPGGSNAIGTHSLSVPAPYNGDTQCFVSTNQNNPPGAGHSPNFNNQCHTSWPSSNDKFSPLNGPINERTYMVLHVQGSPQGSDSSASGTVTMEYKIGNGDWQNLGGRFFTGSDTTAHFVPRGTPITPGANVPFVPAEWTDSNSPPYYPEFVLYEGLRLRYNTEIQFRFELINNTPQHRLRWRPTSIRIFTPKFTSKEQVDFACNLPLSKASADANEGCIFGQQLPSHVEYSVNITNPQSPVTHGPAIQLGCTVTTDPDFFNLATFGIYDKDEFVFNYDNHSSCELTNQSAGCPATGASFPGGTPNVGVPQQPDSQGFITGSAQALAICPPNGAVLQSNVSQPQNIRWSESWSSIPGFSSYLWPSSGCLETGPSQSQLPSALQQYPKLSLGDPVHDQTNFSSHFTGNVDPAEVKESDPQYSCESVQIASRLFDTHQPGVLETSAFHGMKPQLGCAWKDVLRDEAVTLGMNLQTHFVAHEPVAGALFPLSGEPTEPCISYQIDGGNSSEKEILGVFEPGEFPAVCSDGSTICQAQFVGFGPGTPGEVTYDFELAAQASGYAAVKAAMPRAEFGCDGRNCVNLELSQDGQHIFSSGEIEIPLLLLMQNTVKLKYNEMRRLEADFNR